MTVGRTGTTRAVAAALAWVCLAGTGSFASAAGTVSGAATVRPAAAQSPTTRPAGSANPALSPPPPVHSEVGQRAIRRDGRAAPSTQPASNGTATSPETPIAPSLGLPKVAGALAIVLTLIVALRAVMKRAFVSAGGPGASRAVQLLTRTVISPKQYVLLLRVGNRLVVVADSGGTMSPLSEITDPDEVAALVGQIRDEKLSAAGPTFGGLLGRLRSGMDAESAGPESEQPSAMPAIDRFDAPENGEDAGTIATRQEIHGLLAKVRLLSHQFRGT